MLTYIIQMIACSGVLYTYYHFFLRNEKFHQYNRFYLLFAIACSLIVPLIKVPVFVKTEMMSNTLYYLMTTEDNVVVTVETGFNWRLLLYVVYTLISITLISRLIVSIRKIFFIKAHGTKKKVEDILFIDTPHSDAPFSFFNWLFWNEKTQLQSVEGQQMFRHEHYHILSKHTLDIIFMEIVLCIFWFNPMFYIYRKEMKVIQEFLADKYAVEKDDSANYAQLLVLRAMGTNSSSLTSPFFNTFLKRRITMLLSSEKTSHHWLKQLLIVPVFVLTASLLIIRCKSADAKTETKISSTPLTTKTKLNTAGITKNTPDQRETEIVAVIKKSAELRSATVEKNSNQLHSKIFSKVDIDAKYDGNWRSFLERNINGQVAVDNGASPGTFTVIIQFVVDENGNVSDLTPLTHHGYGMEEEAIRVIELSGKWTPAVQDGESVKAYRKQPLTFQITEE
ncbi:M56 family metallopeptidase [Niabella yanshanensis]|uniref:M56 family metallopeptidase n=1 Tax=Niabella yanshanensis TaxID=577386 RepID=A0ABZ0W780_9BACT|nr:M56 family metallopeptidase [Niabella yanshanensis]WQD39112.1 M56 family metallopeptidase [Niabella yanshanensis]